MPDRSNHGPQRADAFDHELAESLVFDAYVELSFQPRRADGAWVAPLTRFRNCELRLVEAVAAAPGLPVLRVELLDLRAQTAVESRSCEEIEDAIAAFKAMIPIAAAYELNESGNA
jgi:hypothetical protein